MLAGLSKIITHTLTLPLGYSSGDLALTCLTGASRADLRSYSTAPMMDGRQEVFLMEVNKLCLE